MFSQNLSRDTRGNSQSHVILLQSFPQTLKPINDLMGDLIQSSHFSSQKTKAQRQSVTCWLIRDTDRPGIS